MDNDSRLYRFDQSSSVVWHKSASHPREPRAEGLEPSKLDSPDWKSRLPIHAVIQPQGGDEASFLARPRPLLPSIASLSGLEVSHLFAPFGPSKTRLHAVLACAAVPFNEFDAKIRSKSHSSKVSIWIRFRFIAVWPVTRERERERGKKRINLWYRGILCGFLASS